MKKVFWVGAIFTLVVPLGIGLFGVKIGLIAPDSDNNLPWLALLVGVFITLISRIDDFAEFSLGPLKARMNEKIVEADTAIQDTRQIAVRLTKTALTDLMAGNFFDSMSLRNRLDLHDELVQTLRDIGATDEQIADAEEMWRRGIGVTYHRAIKQAFLEREEANRVSDAEGASPDLQGARDGFQDLLQFHDNWQAPSPAEMEDYLREQTVLNADAQEWIDDYQHYLETGEIRRRELFATK